MIKIGLLIASFVFLFIVAFRGATSATFNSTLTLCRSCSCSLFNVSLQVNCWRSWQTVDSEQLSEQLVSLLSSRPNLTFGHLWIRHTSLTHVPRFVCRLTTLTQLSLDNNRLTRLPDNCLTNLTALTSLVAWSNSITELQVGLFGGARELTLLDLSFNRITELRDGLFDGLRQLETLHLFYNRISSIGLRVFGGLSNLKTLTLSYNSIGELENGIFDGLYKLEILNIRHNYIASIGSRVFNRLFNLKTLCLSYNRITKLQDRLFDRLYNLVAMQLSYNLITELRDKLFGGLHKLETLNISHNHISSIGSRVFNRLFNLTTLALSYNGIAELQNGLFDGLYALETLDLSHNHITSIGSQVFDGLSNLKTLSVSYNGITELRNGLFDGLHTLETLYIHHNDISSIGSRVFGSSATQSSLTYVDMSWNYIQTLDSWPIYMGIDRNVTIDLSYNHIRRFANVMRWKDNCGMRKVHVSLLVVYDDIITISDLFRGWNITLSTTWCVQVQTHSYMTTATCVYLECDCVDFVRFNLQWRLPYDYTVSYISRVRPLILKQNNTVHLEQFVCELNERCPSGCRCVHRPANATLHIYCSNTNLTALPLELPIPKSYTKYKLDFSNNPLLRRLEHRDYFVNTSILDVSNSDIQQVESADVWKDILKIPQLNLYGNKLTSLPQSTVSLNVTTVSLNIAKNPWDCSCDNKWMHGWLNAIKDRLTQNVLCYSPHWLSGKNIMHTREKEFCDDPVVEAAVEAAAEASKRALIISMSSVAGVVVVLLSVIAIFYCLRVKVYTRWKFHPFDRDECLGEDMDYDVFLCCSSLDDQPLGDGILDSVEANGYRVCYHERDFVPGLIMDNIEASVTRSKRTVCLLTSNFIQRSVSVSLVALFLSFGLCHLTFVFHMARQKVTP